MPMPDSNWIAVDCGGTTTKVSFRTKAGKPVVNLEFPTVFHYSLKDGKISVAESALELMEDFPEGILLLEKKHFRSKKVTLVSDRRTSVKLSDIFSTYLSHIRTHCEKEYFDRQPVSTCVFTVRPPYRSRHAFLQDAAKAAGFQNVMIRDDAVALATAWYHDNGMQSSEYVLLCDFGGDATTLTLLRHKYGGFERIAARHSSDVRHGGNGVQKSIFDSVFKQLRNSQSPKNIESWLKKKNAFLFKIGKNKELYFGKDAEFHSNISVGKKTLKIDEKRMDQIAFTAARHQVEALNEFWANCKKGEGKVNMDQISLVVAGNAALSPYVEGFIRKMEHEKTFFPDNKKCTAAAGVIRMLDADPLGQRTGVPFSRHFTSAYAKAIAGESMAQYDLGKCYYCGRGTPIIEEEAFFWFQRAAEQGHVKAVYQLGKCYLKGLGCVSDISMAVRFFQLAARQGNAKAQYRLGGIYSEKRSEFHDDEQALSWLRKSAQSGHAKAAGKLEELDRKQPHGPQKRRIAERKRKRHVLIVEKIVGAFLSCLILFLGGFTFIHARELNRTVVIGGVFLIVSSVFVSVYAAILLARLLHVTASDSRADH